MARYAVTPWSTELPGRPLAELAAVVDQAAVLRASGRDLARLNQLPVVGFGWFDRS